MEATLNHYHHHHYNYFLLLFIKPITYICTIVGVINRQLVVEIIFLNLLTAFEGSRQLTFIIASQLLTAFEGSRLRLKFRTLLDKLNAKSLSQKINYDCFRVLYILASE
jgi:hypothetical protein